MVKRQVKKAKINALRKAAGKVLEKIGKAATDKLSQPYPATRTKVNYLLRPRSHVLWKGAGSLQKTGKFIASRPAGIIVDVFTPTETIPGSTYEKLGIEHDTKYQGHYDTRDHINWHRKNPGFDFLDDKNKQGIRLWKVQERQLYDKMAGKPLDAPRLNISPEWTRRERSTTMRHKAASNTLRSKRSLNSNTLRTRRTPALSLSRDRIQTNRSSRAFKRAFGVHIKNPKLGKFNLRAPESRFGSRRSLLNLRRPDQFKLKLSTNFDGSKLGPRSISRSRQFPKGSLRDMFNQRVRETTGLQTSSRQFPKGSLRDMFNQRVRANRPVVGKFRR